jgi:type I restriction enzyme, S subunit
MAPDPVDFCIAQDMVAIRANPKRVYPRFLFAVLRSAIVQARISNMHVGSLIPHFKKGDFDKLLIPVPDRTAQTRIGDIYFELSAKIESNRRTSRTLERLARAIFRAWFVDFEPVKAKATGASSFPNMPQVAFDALPTRLIESELGLIPEFWGVGRLGENCEINARSVRKSDIEGEIEYIDISSVTVGQLKAVQRVLYADAPSRARRRVRHGDTIWSCVRPNHRSYLFIHTPPDNRIVSTGFAVLSPRSFGPSFLHQLTIQPEFVDYLVSNADGSAYPAVRPEHFASAEVIVPPPSLGEAFEALTMPCRDLIASSDRECAKLTALRDYLLPKLLSGEVRGLNLGNYVGEGPTR